MNKTKVAEIFNILTQNIKNPTSELNYHNLFTLLVAVVLSAQATDSGVNKATANLFSIIKTPQDILNLGEDALIENIKSIGLYKSKAKHIMQTSAILVNEYQGEVPNTLEKLIKLPGVGRKTANVVLNVYFNQPTMPVDTHIFRLSHRIGLSNGKDVLQVEKDLLKIIPKQYLQKAHHLLILHGRYICKAKKFDCNTCCINKLCEKNF